MAVNIFFTYGDEVIKLPVLPEELTMTYSGANTTQEIIKIGEINILKLPKLMDLSIESFFPANELAPYNRATGSDYRNTQELVNFFTKVQNELKPLKFTITGVINKETVTSKKSKRTLNLLNSNDYFHKQSNELSVSVDSFQLVKIMSVEHFEWTLKQDNDIYFKMDLKEYKDYGSKKFKKIYQKSDKEEDGLVFKGQVEKTGKERSENFVSKAVKTAKTANQAVRTVARVAGTAKKAVNEVKGVGTFIKTATNTVKGGKLGI